MTLFRNPEGDSVPADDVLQTALELKIKLRRYIMTMSVWLLPLIMTRCQAPLRTKEEIEVEMCRNNL